MKPQSPKPVSQTDNGKRSRGMLYCTSTKKPFRSYTFSWVDILLLVSVLLHAMFLIVFLKIERTTATIIFSDQLICGIIQLIFEGFYFHLLPVYVLVLASFAISILLQSRIGTEKGYSNWGFALACLF